MAKKTEIKITATDQRIEEEAIKGRRSKKVDYLSSRGPRDYKVTVLIPSSLNEDVKDLKAVTKRSLGDIVNEALEDYVKKNADKLERIRAIMDESTE